MTQPQTVTQSATAEQPATSAPVGVVHHYVLSVLHQSGKYAWSSGTMTLPPGATRSHAFNHLLQQAKQSNGHDVAAVLFFELAPNRL